MVWAVCIHLLSTTGILPVCFVTLTYKFFFSLIQYLPFLVLQFCTGSTSSWHSRDTCLLIYFPTSSTELEHGRFIYLDSWQYTSHSKLSDLLVVQSPHLTKVFLSLSLLSFLHIVYFEKTNKTKKAGLWIFYKQLWECGGHINNSNYLVTKLPQKLHGFKTIFFWLTRLR